MKYDWSQAPNGAIAAVRDKDGGAYWVCITPVHGFWFEDFVDIDPSAIFDDSCAWWESLEDRPQEPTP